MRVRADDGGRSEGRFVTNRIGDGTIAPLRKQADVRRVSQHEIVWPTD